MVTGQKRNIRRAEKAKAEDRAGDIRRAVEVGQAGNGLRAVNHGQPAVAGNGPGVANYLR